MEKVLKFIWKVENFSYCWKETNDSLRSPEFYSDIIEEVGWCLKLYPKGKSSYEDYVSVYLRRLQYSGGPPEMTIDYEIALLRPDGTTEYVKEMKDRCFRGGTKYGFDNLVSRERLFGARKFTLLPNDILTLQCCIFHKNNELEFYTEIIAKTHIEIQRYRRQWKNIDYNNDSISIYGDQDFGDMSFELSVPSESNSQLGVLTGQFSYEEDLTAFHCKIGLLDFNNSVVKLLSNNFLDIEDKSINCIEFPLIAVAELLENPSLYLPNNKLNLDCEFTVCNGTQHSQIEGIAQDANLMPLPVDVTTPISLIDFSQKKFLYCVDNLPSSLTNDFQNLYHERTVSDFTIKVRDKNFEVHKAILCARSPVFKALLTSNMMESQKNSMDIPDMEEETVHRMLTYMYTGMAGNLDWDTANKLYFAADKYALTTLQRICSEVLYQNLRVTRVREILNLANMHADEYLKKITVEFICDNETEVMRSTEWETFMTEDSNLAAQIMHQIILEKAKNREREENMQIMRKRERDEYESDEYENDAY